jgi:hypothetical protein
MPGLSLGGVRQQIAALPQIPARHYTLTNPH